MSTFKNRKILSKLIFLLLLLPPFPRPFQGWFETLRVFVHRVKFYIGAYIALMNGVDAVVFTAGVGENDYRMRSYVCHNLYNLGIMLDEERNAASTSAEVISEPDSRVKVLYVPTNEELMIARDTVALIVHGSADAEIEWKPVVDN